MATSRITPDQDAIISDIDIAAPPERIFQALTGLKRWFTSPECPAKLWEMDARMDGAYRYATEKGSTAVNGASEFECHGHIVEFDPPRVLAYTWFANWHEDRTRRTLVRWELRSTASGTHVTVTHSDLAKLPIARKDYSGGWPGVVEMLKKFVEQ